MITGVREDMGGGVNIGCERDPDEGGTGQSAVNITGTGVNFSSGGRGGGVYTESMMTWNRKCYRFTT